jgi:hypothetical protein
LLTVCDEVADSLKVAVTVGRGDVFCVLGSLTHEGDAMLRRMLAITTLLAVAGCAPAIVLKPDVPGPHGEHLAELQCGLPDGCLAFARQLCGGDFDIVSTGSAQNDTTVMLIHCKNGRAVAAPPEVETYDPQ